MSSSRGFRNYDKWKLSNAWDEQDAADAAQWRAKSPEEREDILQDIENEASAAYFSEQEDIQIEEEQRRLDELERDAHNKSIPAEGW